MKIIIFGKEKDSKNLFKTVALSLEELGLSSFITLDKTKDEKLKKELSIQKEPAVILEEKNIDFKDVIFEGIEPNEEEIKSMLISIIGGGENTNCSGDCNGCSC